MGHLTSSVSQNYLISVGPLPPSFPVAFWDQLKTIKILVRSRRPFAPRRRRLTRTARRSRRFAARARTFHLAQQTVSEPIQPIPLIQFPIDTLSPPLEISYSPISNPSPIPTVNVPPHPPSPPQVDTTPSTLHHGYSPAAPFPHLFHEAQELLEFMEHSSPSNQDLVVVRIPGSDGLFSVPVASLVLLDLFSLNPNDPVLY